ncbi:hypothetical protein CUMW_142220 [Citrus unshiu]|nr:hypothetical protein CUMW_142220 [Citrus unshiu]
MERRTFRDHLCNWLGFTFLWRLQVLHRREEGQERRGIEHDVACLDVINHAWSSRQE